MSNQELWEHCFEDESFLGDFCRQEWEKRDIFCLCPADIRTGWIETDGKCACNICGKEQEGETLFKKKRPRCHNCKFAGDRFKIHTITHMHCEHPKYKPEDFESGKLTAWDTLQEFWQSCKDHEFKVVEAQIFN